MKTALVLAGMILLSALLTFLVERRRFGRFWKRSCTGRTWKTAFPDASADEIRKFLAVFVEAFVFGRTRGLQFEPTDQLLDIYRTRYPSRFDPDMMELEILVKLVRQRFGVDLVPVWHPAITLGEVFERVRKRVA